MTEVLREETIPTTTTEEVEVVEDTKTLAAAIMTGIEKGTSIEWMVAVCIRK